MAHVSGGTVKGPTIRGTIVEGSGADWSQQVVTNTSKVWNPASNFPFNVKFKDYTIASDLNRYLRGKMRDTQFWQMMGTIFTFNLKVLSCRDQGPGWYIRDDPESLSPKMMSSIPLIWLLKLAKVRIIGWTVLLQLVVWLPSMENLSLIVGG